MKPDWPEDGLVMHLIDLEHEKKCHCRQSKVHLRTASTVSEVPYIPANSDAVVFIMFSLYLLKIKQFCVLEEPIPTPS